MALALMLGIALAGDNGGKILPVAVLFAGAVFFPQLSKKNYREAALRGVLLLAAGALGTGCMLAREQRWENEKQVLLHGQQIKVCGTLVRKEQKGNDWQLILALPGYKNHLIVSTQDSGYPLDCVLSVEGPIKEFNLPRNEGQFNERQYYKNRGIIGRIYAKKVVCLRVPDGIAAWRERLYLLRLRMCEVFASCLPAEEAGIMSAMAAGEKTLLDAQVRTLFQRMGISHILAISGMHISMIGMSIYTLLRKCRCSYLCCSLTTAVVLLVYGTMIGMGTASERAIGMFFIYLLAQCLGRRYDTCAALAVLATLLLADNPFLLFDMSFQFSFLAVFAVVTAEMVLQKKKDAARNHRLLHTIVTSLLLQLFTLPLVAYYNYEVPLYALFLNLLLLPYLSLALGFGLVGGIAGMVRLPCINVLLWPCRVVLSTYVWACEMVEKLPLSTVICGQPSGRKLWLYYGFLCMSLLVLEYMKKRKNASMDDRGHSASYGCLAAGILLLPALIICTPAGGFEIDYLDVGQGDGSMICTEDGIVCFIDGGSTDVSGVGSYRILPFLKSKCIRKVDYWILSHLDDDHVNGFYEVLEAGYRIDAVVISALMPEDEPKQRLLGTLAQYEIPVIEVCGGDSIRLKKNVCLDSAKDECGEGADAQNTSDAMLSFLSPDVETPVYDCNGASLVCLYEDEHVRALWTGDIGKSQEEWLMKSGKLHEIDIYKAAHHGSKYSNSEEYLKILSPKLSVISCGKYNRYGHPDAEAIARIQAVGSRVFYTMQSGQIKVIR